MFHVLKMFWSNKTGLSVGFTFFTVSVLFGSWIARIPEVKAQLQMSEAQLGLVLLGLPIGAALGTLMATRQLRRMDLGRFTYYGALIMCFFMLFPAWMPTPLLLGIALFCVGFSEGMANVGMNSAASQVEKTQNILIMSACHGMFSLGGMIGAVSAGFVASLGVPLWLHLSGVVLILVILNYQLRFILLSIPNLETPSVGGFSLPPKALWGLAVIGFCIMLGEGAIADWSAIFLKEIRLSNVFVAALGFAGFSFFMALGRFFGDGLIQHFGYGNLVLGGSLLGGMGLLLAIAVPVAWITVIGFSLTGLGFSIVVPILFGRSAQLCPDRPAEGIAGIATSGIVGFMIGPPAIGFIAESFGLSNGLLTVVLLSLLAVVIAFRLKW